MPNPIRPGGFKAKANGEVIWNNWAQVRAVKDVWYNALPPYVDKPQASTYALPSKREEFYDKHSFFHCPSAKLPREVQDPLFQIAVFSMAMNSQLISFDAKPSILYSRIQKPAHTVLFLDNLLAGEEKVVKGQDGTFLGQPSSYAPRFAGRRHLRGGNLTFADGHAEWYPGEKVVETQGFNAGWNIYPPKDIFWGVDGTY